MDIYLVGGAVRDTLLGLPVTDHDWLVVGSSPEEMTALGFVPVGRDFPVFCTHKPMRNTPWLGPSARPSVATMALPSMPHPRSHLKKIWRVVI